MLKERARDYYLNHDYNCAETLLLAANDEYGLGLPPEAFKVIGGFGGGMGCGRACGALCGAIGAIGARYIDGQAHRTAGFKELCAEYAAAFREKLGSDQCDDLVKVYKKDGVRCVATVELAADLLEEFMAAHGK